MSRRYQHLFGPVPSRRFGRSLGVDLTPLKTCTLDCVFCQLGRTSRNTLERGEHVPLEEVKAELLDWHRAGGTADYVTLAGSGEPTLHSGFGEVLRWIKEQIPIPAVLLSNGTLFHLPEVREAARAADIVKLSLSAWDARSFRRVNRPNPDLQFELCVAGMRAFRQVYAGKLWLEVFLIRDLNSDPRAVRQIARLAGTIAPDEIHLNTAVRPTADPGVLPVAREDLEELAALFTPRATIVAGFPTRHATSIRASADAILDMLRRHPCTAQQITDAFATPSSEVAQHIDDLARAGCVQTFRSHGEIYFDASPQHPTDPASKSRAPAAEKNKGKSPPAHLQDG